ncbi:hypothetical protein [Tropicimonas marinistellae]|uniref:hypothetical protein n=1 Tax=Tropicimonas marinistellae TaxID=1739787 RepID=UPI00083238D5|nr:hypothetical protein [Tropicimonas marinistellae]
MPLAGAGLGMMLATLAPAAADTETAHCTILKTCDGAGACRADGTKITFGFEPIKVRRSGEGTWRVTYGGKSVQAEGVSYYGPFLWAEGSRDIQSLMTSDETHMLWHSADDSGALVRFMKCEEG